MFSKRVLARGIEVQYIFNYNFHFLFIHLILCEEILQEDTPSTVNVRYDARRYINAQHNIATYYMSIVLGITLGISLSILSGGM